MIELTGLTKRYGPKTVVDDLTVTVRPGTVTGFLGPNGAGKSTTLRMLVGLEQPTAGTATIDGRRYAELRAPLREIGVMLEPGAVHPGRTARNHLLALAQTHRIPASRVDDVLDVVGLADVARSRAGSFSMGMGQRLGIAAALLGDPRVVVLDEPVNGLDVEGIRWIRELLRGLADEGRTVFVSSHLMSEVAVTADQLVVLGRGRLIADVAVADLVAGSTTTVRVVGPPRLRDLLADDGVTVTAGPDGALDVVGLDATEIGARAAAASLALSELTPRRPSLEEAFLELTEGAVEFSGSAPGPTGTAPTPTTARKAA